jgi:hypothetical protein
MEKLTATLRLVNSLVRTIALVRRIFFSTAHTSLYGASELFRACDDFLRLYSILNKLRYNRQPKDGLHDVRCLGKLETNVDTGRECDKVLSVINVESMPSDFLYLFLARVRIGEGRDP